MVEGHVEQIEDWTYDDGVRCITLIYTYSVHGERHGRGRSVLVHYKPSKPRISVLSRQHLLL
jgi:hypothetical protein